MILDSWGIKIIAVALLNPNRVYSSILTNKKIEDAKKYFNQMIGDLNNGEDVAVEGETSSQREYLASHPFTLTYSNELDLFLQQSPIKECDLLNYWNQHSEQFPRLSKVAIIILSIPTSSAGIERVFSLAKELMGNKQLRMNKELIETRMLILGNSDLFEDFLKENFHNIFPQLC